jgi:hypothetical protein
MSSVNKNSPVLTVFARALKQAQANQPTSVTRKGNGTTLTPEIPPRKGPPRGDDKIKQILKQLPVAHSVGHSHLDKFEP